MDLMEVQAAGPEVFLVTYTKSAFVRIKVEHLDKEGFTYKFWIDGVAVAWLCYFFIIPLLVLEDGSPNYFFRMSPANHICHL